MKVLRFTFFGKPYEVNEQGHIRANGLQEFSPQWVFLGGSSHHWHNRITVRLEEAFQDPARLNGCLGWDCDYGTMRQWGGAYYGKLPRIQRARVEEIA